MVSVGDMAPDFALATADGTTVYLSDFAGRKLVLYFYPKDDTTGCTREAQDFSALAKQFADADTAVVGVSKDSVASHGKFTKKYALQVPLGSDPDGAACEAYGVWGEKSLYGRKYMGIERSTFLIDRTARIARIWPKVKVAGHAEAVLEEARTLG
jgi:thioredoxin-dependent peroxiredoxin